MTALREIKLLRELESPYVVRLLDVFPHKRNLSLVIPYLHIVPAAVLQARHMQQPCQSCQEHLPSLPFW